MPIGAIAGAVVGGLFQQSAADTAAGAQRASDAARLEEEQRVREQLRADTEAQRVIADQAFRDYQRGLLTYGQAQQKASQALQQVQQRIGQSQLSDVAKTQEMAKFQPYSIRSGAGQSFFDPTTGKAGFNLSPGLAQAQEGLLNRYQQAVGNLPTAADASQNYVQAATNLLNPVWKQEDVQARAADLAKGRIGVGVSSEAAGLGEGSGLYNAGDVVRERLREQTRQNLAMKGLEVGQQYEANALANVGGMFQQAMAPETYGLDVLSKGVGYGQTAQQGGINQANLYAGGMGDYYRSLLGAAQTGAEGALAIPGAQRAGQQEAYQRQQTYLGQLQGSNLPYQAMTTPQAIIPGSAYAMGSIGSGLMSAGIRGIQNQINPQQQGPTGYSGTGYSWLDQQIGL